MQEYWLVDLVDRTVEVIDLQTGIARQEDPVRSSALPDLALSLAEIFD